MKNEAEDDQGQNVAPYRDWAPTWLRGLIAFTAGCLLLDMGLHSLDVRIEWFIGLDTFSFSWVLAMIPLPVLAGVVVGLIYGFGGKYLAHFPPVLVLGWCYYESMSHFPLPDGTKLMPWQFWAFFLILQMEFCALGAVFGEVLHHRLRGWDNRIKYGADSEYLCDQEEIMLKKLN